MKCFFRPDSTTFLNQRSLLFISFLLLRFKRTINLLSNRFFLEKTKPKTFGNLVFEKPEPSF